MEPQAQVFTNKNHKPWLVFAIIILLVVILLGVISYLVINKEIIVNKKDPVTGFTLDIISDSSSWQIDKKNRKDLSWVLTRIGYEKNKPMPLIEDISQEYAFDTIVIHLTDQEQRYGIIRDKNKVVWQSLSARINNNKLDLYVHIRSNSDASLETKTKTAESIIIESLFYFKNIGYYANLGKVNLLKQIRDEFTNNNYWLLKLKTKTSFSLIKPVFAGCSGDFTCGHYEQDRTCSDGGGGCSVCDTGCGTWDPDTGFWSGNCDCGLFYCVDDASKLCSGTPSTCSNARCSESACSTESCSWVDAPICVPDCSCAASTCNTSSCPDGCTGSCPGELDCTPGSTHTFCSGSRCATGPCTPPDCNNECADDGECGPVTTPTPTPPPLPPAKPPCAYGPELITNPSLTNLTGWTFYNNGNTSYSFTSNGIATLTSAGGTPVSGGFIQQISGLAGKRVLLQAALRRKIGGSSNDPYANIGILHSPGTWEWNYPSGTAYFPSSSDNWEVVGNSTSTYIPSDVTMVMPAGNIYETLAGDYYVGWISMCEETPGSISGRVINQVNNAYLKSSAVCTTGTVVTGLSIGFGSGLLANVDQCDPNPYYSRSLGANNYTVTANLPVGWEAVSWDCTSLIGGVEGGTSCPGEDGTQISRSSGPGGVVTGVVLKANETASIWFYVQPIAPTCTISGSSKVSLGSNWMGSVMATVPGAATAPVSAEGAWSTSLTLGTRLGILNGVGSVTTPISWTPTDADIGNTYNFYCRGNNGLDWTSPIRQCRPFAYGAYPSDVDCFNGTKNSTCLGTGTDCIPVEVTDTDAWFQVQGGDTHGQLGITSYVPATATNPMFSPDLDTYPGLISYAPPNTYDFHADITNYGLPLSSSKKWLAQSGFTSTTTSFYAYFVDKLKNSITAANTLTSCDSFNPPNSGINVYLVNGNCAIGNNLSIGASAKVVVLVSGDLNITGNSTKITVASGGFLNFIVQGNISVDDKLGEKQLTNTPFVEGVYISDGIIRTSYKENPADPQSGNRFIGGGIFYGKTDVNLGRDLKPNGCSGHACNSYTPAEMFIFRPDLVINAPFAIWEPKIDWQEVVP